MGSIHSSVFIALMLTKNISKFEFNISIILLILAMAITISRTGAIVAFVSLSVFYFMSVRGKLLRLGLLFATGIAGLCMLYVYVSIFSNSNRSALNFNNRDQAWYFLYQSIMENPMLGVGFGISREAILIPNGVDFGAHNFYLEHLSEVGLLGVLCTIMMFLVNITYVLRRRRNNKEDKNLLIWANAVVAFMPAVLLYMMTESALYRFSAVHFFLIFVLGCTSLSGFWRVRIGEIANASAVPSAGKQVPG